VRGDGDATALLLGHLAQAARRHLEVAQDAFGRGNQFAPGRRNLYAACVAEEEGHAQDALEALDGARERRL
jgi:hypothetical protein